MNHDGRRFNLMVELRVIADDIEEVGDEGRLVLADRLRAAEEKINELINELLYMEV